MVLNDFFYSFTMLKNGKKYFNKNLRQPEKTFDFI